MAPYVYVPLDEEAKEIRLLTLLPGIWSSEIKIVVENIELTEDNKPQYEALSYVWGPAIDLAHIKVGLSNESLGVTQNLATALPYLRYEDRPRHLWIDAICVNQQDVTERSKQVLRMGDVYRWAERVLVWLGPEDQTSGFAIETLRTLSSRIEVDWTSRAMHPCSEGDIELADHMSELRLADTTLDAIHALLERPWFERIWIQQEIRLANPHTVVCCGFGTILWQQFCNAIFCITIKPKPKEIPALVQRLEMALGLRKKGFSGADHIHATRHCKCSDPRDRVYALLSLAVGAEGMIDIKPDYFKTVGQVYQDFVLGFVEHLHDSNILNQCELQGRLEDVPSWVPNWSIPSEATFRLPESYASGMSACQMQFVGNGTLRAAGLKVASISKSQDAFMDCNQLLDVVTAIRRLIPLEAYNKSTSYIGGGSLSDAFCRTFCCDHFVEGYMPPAIGLADLQKSKEAFDYFLTHEAGPLTNYYLQYADKYWFFAWGFCEGRSIITTKEKYIGLAPRTTKANDIVCVLLGCRSPLVLRPTENGQYKIVGPCYICGLMDAEALLGPLPGHFQRVRQLDEVSIYRVGYINRETRAIQIHDPRLGPLPAGWRKKNHTAEGTYPLFVKEGDSVDETQKGNPEWADPRLTREALAAQGVELTDFELV